MSRHKSYGKRYKGTVDRTVLRRYERIVLLKKRGKLSHDEQVIKLVKTKP